MKFLINDLKAGDQVRAEVVEITDPHSILVSFQGDLILVQNHTYREFVVGQKIKLRVTAVRPLAFQLVDSRRGLDVSI